MKRKIKGFAILVFLFTVQLFFAQEKAVSGIVSDGSGPIPGANVVVKGTSNGVQTDFDGKYKIKAKTGDVIVFSYMGMKDQSITVGNSSTVNVKMQDGGEQLEEVVVTALGVKKEEKKLGYAVSKITSDEITKSGEQNVLQALAGKAAGVQVIGTGGTPGASSKIIIRGVNTIKGNSDPLIVVDGIPIDNTTSQTSAGDNPFNANLSGINNSNRALDINPDDIESVSVLKGPAAAALYGERAGNGVIIYTTKKGKSGKSLGIDYSTALAIDHVSQLPARQNKYVQGTSATATAVNPNTPQSWGPSAESLNIPMYNNVKNFFQEGLTFTNNISFYGGNEKATYRASYGNVTQTGMIPETGLKRNTLRVVGDLKLNEKWKTGGSLQYTHTTNTLAQNGSNSSGVMLSLLRSPSNYDLRNYKDGEGNNMNYYNSYDNPYFTVNENPATSDVNRVFGNMYFTYSPAAWLSFTAKGGIDTYSDYRKQVYAISSNGDNLAGMGEVAFNNINNKQFYVDFIATGLLPLKSEWLKINYTAGLNLRSSQNTDVFSRGKDLAVRNLYNLSNATQLYASNAESNVMSRALFGQLEFDVKNQLFITGSLRKEWSSTYGTDANSALFPAASASWVLSSSFDLPEWINFMKMTYGYGEVGIAPQPYYTISTFSQPFMTDGFTDGLSFPYNGVNGMAVSGVLGNQQLKPERVLGHELGFNTKFLENRLSFDLNLYYKTSKDLLIELPLPQSSGYALVYQNAAELVNKGIEVELGYDIFKKNNAFQWNINLNWSKNENKVTDIYGNLDEISIETAFGSIGYYAVKGQPLGSFYGTKWKRDENGQKIIGSNGLPIVADETGNLGNSAPKWTGGLRNTFTYKRVTLSGLLDFRHGGVVYNGTLARLHNFGVSEASADREHNYIIDGVKQDGTPNNIAISAKNYYQKYLGDGGGAAEEAVTDVNWIRLRDITLSYDFNVKKFTAINSAQLSFTGRNLWLNTNYKGVDPETSLTGAGSKINGLDYFNNPGSKSFIMTLKVGF
ncbi:SusC/RagA family TonB-linked outer membrane protein [Flavobacterium sp. S87F.05.LMB.W.Kidney.N]|uniref:SusC/RagA family TonB-linked outer membrane protein n=1 Tax=Flavobacterium sp. S87F.05.LMB.W.Kidney.N TaxID=1278758 RepID=UPI001065316A|nr:SusC/RagA family TonB-linked outer membrane protein [Flavobacterium sp. S87F.05.LMB.W.Kidney.N]TDX09361.1 TonB-linked SusC/RagA family outer membrane protein [Flavobacterium sp. S87F.05.LMB.W.Kidney.N]